MNKFNVIAIVILVVLGGLYAGADYFNTQMERGNVSTLSEIKYDNTAYNYVKEKCDSGFFASDSDNCQNTRGEIS